MSEPRMLMPLHEIRALARAISRTKAEEARELRSCQENHGRALFARVQISVRFKEKF
jgi:hypothetical protein